MAQQTAISWLKDMLEWNYGDPQMLEISWENLDDLLERAKQMEEEQIIEANNIGYVCGNIGNGICGEKYYKKTYKK